MRQPRIRRSPAGGVARGAGQGEVAEFQGLYGAFEFPERLLQKIWRLGFFLQSGLKTDDGRAIEMVAPGDWNHMGGPDFRDAELRIDGRPVRGDVELHFHARDWRNHGHHRNPEFDGVVLHVSLFAPDADAPPALTSKGVAIPLLVLLPHLACSIEEFALEDALEQVTGAGARDGLTAFFRGRPAVEVRSELTRLAKVRWMQKTGFARVRIEKLGWEGACHHTALEILGYRHNRAPMLSVAETFPLARWAGGPPQPQQLWECGGSRWRVPGTRPANHPQLRLAQYAAWTRAAPRWPERLLEVAELLPREDCDSPLDSVAAFRRRCAITRLRERFSDEAAGGAVTGSRLDTIVTNGFLPLLAARGYRELFPTWCCWFAGDAPDWMKAAMREIPARRRGRNPLCEGLFQGALQLALEQPSTAARLGAARRGT